jgi:hypothetical protein
MVPEGFVPDWLDAFDVVDKPQPGVEVHWSRGTLAQGGGISEHAQAHPGAVSAALQSDSVLNVEHGLAEQRP